MNRSASAILVLAGLAAGLWSLGPSAPLGSPVGAAPLQTPEPPPCGVRCDRTVAPLDIMVNEKVNVRVSCSGKCPEQKRAADIFLVVDRTNTMFDARQAGKTYMDAAKEALVQFVNRMDFTTSSVGLITYAAEEHVALNLTRDRTRVLHAINTIKRSEQTDVRGLQEVFRTATQKLDNDGTPGNDKTIIILAAGADQTHANLNMPTVANAAKLAGVRVVFLMYPDSRYTHYVEASSDCSLPICPRWGLRLGPTPKWAWEVDNTSIMSVLLNTLGGVLLDPVQISGLRLYDAMHSCAVFDPASSVPPPTSPLMPPYLDVNWIFQQSDLQGIAVNYEAQLICGGDTYPEAQISRMFVDFTDGNQYVADLHNPPITVRNPPTPSPTSDATETPTVVASPTPTVETPVPTTPTPTPTEGVGFRVFLPALLRAGSF